MGNCNKKYMNFVLAKMIPQNKKKTLSVLRTWQFDRVEQFNHYESKRKWLAI